MLGALRRVAVSLALLVLVAACGSSTVSPSDAEKNARAAAPPAAGGLPWEAPADALGATVIAGLVAEKHETLTHHVHAHLDVFVNGIKVVVPAGVGIDTTDPGVRHSLLQWSA